MTIEWRDDAPANLAKLAVGRCMATVMDEGMRKEVGLLTDTLDQIEGHSRLLRSLSFGDDDYEGHVLDMTGRVLGERQPPSPDPWASVQPRPVVLPDDAKSRFPHLESVTNFLDLPTWLAQNDEAMFKRLFVTTEETATMPDGTVLTVADGDAVEPPIGIEPMTHITRELHARKTLNWPASATSTRATQLGQIDRIEVMYAQKAPTRTPLVVSTEPVKGGCHQAGTCRDT